MNIRHTLIALSAGIFALPSLALAQLGGDPTTPPAGAPSRVMKSLDQIETRTPVIDGAPGVTEQSNGGFLISETGSYYLTEDLVLDSGSGIIISSSGTTLDLNGYQISRTSGTPDGAGISALGSNITIKNGSIISLFSISGSTVIGEGFVIGVSSGSSGLRVDNVNIRGTSSDGIAAREALITNCIISFTGANGIYLGFATSRFGRVENCTVTSASFNGIQAKSVTNSTGTSIGEHGILATHVVDSIGESTATGIDDFNGIVATSVTGSHGISTTGAGISGTTITNCHGETSSTSPGIVSSFGVVSNSYGLSATGTVGISAPAGNVFSSVSSPAIP